MASWPRDVACTYLAVIFAFSSKRSDMARAVAISSKAFRSVFLVIDFPDFNAVLV